MKDEIKGPNGLAIINGNWTKFLIDNKGIVVERFEP
jgi:glutathione peroxidase-family protein